MSLFSILAGERKIASFQFGCCDFVIEIMGVVFSALLESFYVFIFWRLVSFVIRIASISSQNVIQSSFALVPVVQRPDNFILWISHYPIVSI